MNERTRDGLLALSYRTRPAIYPAADWRLYNHLVKLGYAEIEQEADGWTYFKITPAGEAALKQVSNTD